jgi:hypothetical protein
MHGAEPGTVVLRGVASSAPRSIGAARVMCTRTRRNLRTGVAIVTDANVVDTRDHAGGNDARTQRCALLSAFVQCECERAERSPVRFTTLPRPTGISSMKVSHRCCRFRANYDLGPDDDAPVVTEV